MIKVDDFDLAEIRHVVVAQDLDVINSCFFFLDYIQVDYQLLVHQLLLITHICVLYVQVNMRHIT